MAAGVRTSFSLDAVRIPDVRSLGQVLLTALPGLFVALLFVLPLGMILLYAVSDAEVGRILPDTAAQLRDWNETGLPAELDHVAAVEIRDAFQRRALARAATRINRDLPGAYSLMLATGRKAAGLPVEGLRLSDIDPRWRNLDYLKAIKSAAGPYTARYLLAAVDVRVAVDGGVALAPPGQRLYLSFLGRTVWISLAGTALCMLLGYVLAYAMTFARRRVANLMMFLVLVPFWMSLLVRTSAWVLMLRQDGIINKTLQAFGLINEPLVLIYNRFGLYVAMVHILLPFAVLPIFNVMKTIPASQIQAAGTLGARPTAAFLQVYLPQTIPGVVSGALLVFILSTGFYVTPALIGGSGDQMLSYLVQQAAFTDANWGMASSIAILLLLSVVTVVALFWAITPKAWTASSMSRKE